MAEITPTNPHGGGRPTKMSLPVVEKLIAAFHNGFNVSEACEYAGIDRTTYYNWLEANAVFSTQMAAAQSAPNKKAKEIVVKAIQEGDSGLAFRWLERRDPDFKQKGELDINHGLQKTREKIKEFLDDDVDGAYDQSGQPTALDAGDASGEVAQPPSDIS